MKDPEIFEAPVLAWSADGEVLLLRGFRIIDTWEPDALLEILVESDAIQRRPLTGELNVRGDRFFGDVYDASEYGTVQSHPYCISSYYDVLQKFRQFQRGNYALVEWPIREMVTFVDGDNLASKEFFFAPILTSAAKSVLSRFAPHSLPLDFLITQYTAKRADFLAGREVQYRHNLEEIISRSVTHSQNDSIWSGKKILGIELQPPDPDYPPSEYGVSPEEVIADKIALGAKSELDDTTRLDITQYLRREESLWGEFDENREVIWGGYQERSHYTSSHDAYSYLKNVYLVNWASVYVLVGAEWRQFHGVFSPHYFALRGRGEVSLRPLHEDEIDSFWKRLRASSS